MNFEERLAMVVDREYTVTPQIILS
ncbi:MAG TPA: hypothetical protein DDW94_08915 [Deltaproteobacteria bacterium]|nr:hypothetical protein [Deltaproteobacteria bacterium]HCY10846.1 hypothetical protein [Deltaproteobacteria bacterium]